MGPADVATDDLLSHILPFLPADPRRILDVGCGNGLLASRLQRLSHDVVAIDESSNLVNEATSLGLKARVASWPDFEDDPFDVIMFVASLHHLRPLSTAIARAAELVFPGGLLIVEEFDWGAIDPTTGEWFYHLVRVLSAGRILSMEGDTFATQLARTGGEYSFWERSHDHDLHSVEDMWSELRSAFHEVSSTTSPYLFRYLTSGLPNDDLGHSVLARTLEMERRLGQLGAISLIGRRFVGRKTS